jgi:hypothetical protein
MDVMTLSEVFDRSIEILKKHIKTIILFTLAYGILLVIGIFLFTLIGVLLAAFSGAMMGSGYLAIFTIIILAIIIASLVLTQYIGMIKISSQEFFEEEVLTDSAVKVSFKSIFKVFRMLICLLVMFIPVGIIYYYLGKSFFGTFDTLIYSVDIFVGRGIGAIVLLVLFILSSVFVLFCYTTWISFVFHAMIIEEKGVFSSIKRSFSLVRQSFWKLFGSLLLVVFIVYALQISLGGFAALVSSVFYLITKFLNINQDVMSFFTMAAEYASFPLNIVSWLIIMPIGYIMTTMLYFNERFKKEGYDLTLRLKKLQKNQERKQVSEFTN